MVSKYDFIWYCYHHLLDHPLVEKTGFELLSGSKPTADAILDILKLPPEEQLAALGLSHEINEDDREEFLSSFDYHIRQTDQQHILDSYTDPQTKKDYRYIAFHVEYFKNSLIWEEENRLSKFVGEKGKISTQELTLIKLDKFEEVWYALFKDSEQNIYFAKTTSKFLYGCEVGEVMKLKFRIKEYREIKGIKQTVITHIRRKGLW